MNAFIAENLGTIIISAALLCVVALITARLIRNRRGGKSSCSCGCGGCPGADGCNDARSDAAKSGGREKKRTRG